MKILVTGADGQLGQALRPVLEPRHKVRWTDLHDLDVCDAADTLAAVRESRPEVILHLAAWTDVDACEAEPERALRVNALGTRHVAQAAAVVGARVVFLSTDYVFDGRLARPYRESDAPNPLNVYGRSKLEGEAAVRSLAARYRIVRTSGLFGPGGRNFPAAILRARARDGRVRVVTDQVCRPTYTGHLVEALAAIVETEADGVLHVASEGATSWYEFARAILRAAGADETAVEPITSAALARPARRPENSVLATQAYETGYGCRLPHWAEGLSEFLAAWRATGGA
jgi:dTDP-4-dehydrorhamnose reductase